MFILCEIIGGEASGGVETSAVQFFKEDQLPILSEERVTEKQIKELFKFLREPDKEVLLD